MSTFVDKVSNTKPSQSFGAENINGSSYASDLRYAKSNFSEGWHIFIPADFGNTVYFLLGDSVHILSKGISI